MFYLNDVLQRIVDGLYNCTFHKQQPVRDGYQRPFYIAFEIRYQLYSANEQSLKHVFAYVAPFALKFPVDELHERFAFQWFPANNVARRYHEIKQFSFLIADKMELEIEKPSNGALASSCYALDSLMDEKPLDFADTQGRAVHKTYAYAFAKQHFIDEQSERCRHIHFQLHEATVRHHFMEQVEMPANFLNVEMFQAMVA